MIKLIQSLQAWQTTSFPEILKREICALDAESLPLQQGLKYSSIANADSLSVIILKAAEDDDSISVNAGLFYSGIIAGCNCADDPSPVDENNEYCEIIICINKITAETSITLVN